MTDTITTETPPLLPPPTGPSVRRPNRLYQAAAWVGIVAGTVFIVATVFLAGFLVGRHSGDDFGWRQHPGGRMGQPMMTMMPMPPMPMMPTEPGGRPGPGAPAPRPS